MEQLSPTALFVKMHDSLMAQPGRKQPSRKEEPPSVVGERQTPAFVSWSELKKHSDAQDCWLAIHGVVYDVTDFAAVHPGGDIISAFGGRDASDEFEAFHTARVRSRLRTLRVGELTGAPKELAATRDYRHLRQRLWKEGWFAADRSYVYLKDVMVLCLLCLGVFCILAGDGCLVRVLCGGVSVGLALQQVAFVAHDAVRDATHHCSPCSDCCVWHVDLTEGGYGLYFMPGSQWAAAAQGRGRIQLSRLAARLRRFRC